MASVKLGNQPPKAKGATRKVASEPEAALAGARMGPMELRMKVTEIKGILFTVYFESTKPVEKMVKGDKDDFLQIHVVAENAEQAIQKAKALYPSRIVCTLLTYEHSRLDGPPQPSTILF